MQIRTILPSLADSVFSDRLNRIDRLFSQLTGDLPLSVSPPYNLKRISNEKYRLEVSVPGWKESELEIQTAGGQLSITGKQDEIPSVDSEQPGWIHRGISRTDFRLSYTIPEHVKITTAKLENGILFLDLFQDIPDSEKPKKIPIDHQSSSIGHTN